MTWIAKNLWLIPALPLLAASLSALLKQSQRRAAASLAIGSLAISFLLACCAFLATLRAPHGEIFRQFQNFTWLQFGESSLRLGWVLDPLTAIMLVMVTFVGLLIFIYSTGYMAHDKNFTRFFCFLALFAAAMLGIIIANNLLLLFISWELVGLASYLLIGFWYHKPSAAAAAKKAFITTRIGDMGFLIGILWLYSQTGTLLFYDNGNGCLEESALTKLVSITTLGGMAVSTAIALLIFCGAIGKSGQVPLHVWLPDAMEGPTPVSALIHAATMVAAGVFLVARVYPLMSIPPGAALPMYVQLDEQPFPLHLITWIGAITAVFAALIAVAQTDIKRILAYSTVSQLGFMMIGLGVGGVAVGMFHLITHAFFKALLFLGAGSVIHGSHDEQNICRMGGLRKFMPITFVTYAIGMMALCGVPIFFSGFWSKDEILHAAHNWSASQIPFYLAIFGAFLTAFYMTRQLVHVFFGNSRVEFGKTTGSEQQTIEHAGVSAKEHPQVELSREPHESPRVMTVPLIILAAFAIMLGFLGSPAWPWFHSYLSGEQTTFDFSKLLSDGTPALMFFSTIVVGIGIGLAWWIYSKSVADCLVSVDPFEKFQPRIFHWLRRKFFVDEIYDQTIVRLNSAIMKFSDWLDRAVWGGIVKAFSGLTVGLSWISRAVDEQVVNLGFDQGCESVRDSSKTLSKIQDGKVQNYLRYIGVALVVLALALIWGCSR